MSNNQSVKLCKHGVLVGSTMCVKCMNEKSDELKRCSVKGCKEPNYELDENCTKCFMHYWGYWKE